jgi:hypothetical protein
MLVYDIPSVDTLQLPNKIFSEQSGSWIVFRTCSLAVIIAELGSDVSGRAESAHSARHTHYRVMSSPSTISTLTELTRCADNRTH